MSNYKSMFQICAFRHDLHGYKTQNPLFLSFPELLRRKMMGMRHCACSKINFQINWPIDNIL